MPYLKMLWTTESPTPQIGSWDYWTSAEKVLFTDSNGSSVTKSNKKIAYYAVAYTTASNYRPVLVSPDPDAVSYNSYSGEKTYNGTITDSNGIVWYYNSLQAVGLYFSNRPDFCINNTPCALTDAQQIAQDLIDRIYAVPFHEDYQPSGRNYITVPVGDIRKTVRKALGLHLAFNVQYYSTNSNYQALSDGVDGMIDDIVNNDRSTNGNIHIQINPYYATSPTSATRTLVRYMTDNRSLTARIGAKEIYNNLPHYQTTYSTSMDYYERTYQNATYRYYGSSAISGGLIGVRCFDRESTLSANNAGIDL